jgi:hypothetical protein
MIPLRDLLPIGIVVRPSRRLVIISFDDGSHIVKTVRRCPGARMVAEFT